MRKLDLCRSHQFAVMGTINSLSLITLGGTELIRRIEAPLLTKLTFGIKAPLKATTVVSQFES